METRRTTPIRWGAARGRVVVAALALLSALACALPVAAQDDNAGLTIALNEYERSGVSGWAKLTPGDSGVDVEMAVEGEGVIGDHPTHIHTGTCTDFQPNPLYPLTTVNLDPLSDDGTSRTAVEDVNLDELLAGDHVILIHKSVDELTTYFVCGDLKRSNAFVGESVPGTVAAPSTGAGLRGDGTAAPPPYGLAAAAVALAAAGFWLRRRSRFVG